MSESPTPHPHLRLDRDGAVLTVTLANAERRNAQTPSLWAALAKVAAELDPGVRVVVLRGEGPSFSAGLDRGMLAPGGVPGEVDMIAMATDSAEAAAEVIEDFQRGFSAWPEVSPVVVAVVQGHAIGAGFQLALAADLRVVADDVQFAMRETSLGLVPDLAGLAPLVAAVGPARALEICATGRFVGAAEAVDTGLANVAVPLAELAATTADLVAALLSAPDAALRALKPLVRSAATADRATQLRLEREAQGRLLHELSGLSGR
ncbi:enoyl-CoA hydratase/isomerase family protein [Nostocoides sp. HKS02]|uniref:enoyl-CoA hydratase/isomerase family protein n=1 Tax=Nostocoides sp. HKS02 TaxID=1813880 RepID=UPI0012B498BC|nr:enoyl-CoA hydratase/isomerase family protein [Tetrasphaera sp. HKS02]QGN57213.1 enoyl-CoA hydratase/isomerase family protein [Tetrasphaera sp. HKS02]